MLAGLFELFFVPFAASSARMPRRGVLVFVCAGDVRREDALIGVVRESGNLVLVGLGFLVSIRALGVLGACTR